MFVKKLSNCPLDILITSIITNKYLNFCNCMLACVSSQAVISCYVGEDALGLV